MAMKFKKGFTLIELIVVTLVFGILLTVGTNIFLQVILSSNKVSTDADLRQNASFVMENITRDVRRSSCLLISNNKKTLRLYGTPDCTGNDTVYTVNNSVSKDGNQLSTPKVDFSTSTFDDTSPTSNGKGVIVKLVVKATGARYDYIGEITETQTISVRNGIY